MGIGMAGGCGASGPRSVALLSSISLDERSSASSSSSELSSRFSSGRAVRSPRGSRWQWFSSSPRGRSRETEERPAGKGLCDGRSVATASTRSTFRTRSTQSSACSAAGHSAIGKLKYAEPIKETLARHAYESGEPQYWPDTSKQTEFEQNPLASAPMRSLVSIPIREGDEILGVFNAISSEKDAFDDAEQTFLTSLAGVIAVAVSVWHKDQKSVAKSDRGQH